MMNFASPGLIVLALMLAKWLVELWLARLNRRHVLAHADAVPEEFRAMIDEPTYGKAVKYALAKNRFGQFEDAWNTLVLSVVLFSGVLPAGYRLCTVWLGTAVWSQAACLFAVGVALVLAGLPLDWHAQFKLEERFGFNTTTPRLWWIDRGPCLPGIDLRRPISCK